MQSRAIMAALLNRALYREVRDDPEAVLHALSIVTLAGIAVGIGLIGLRFAEGESGTGFGDAVLVMWAAVVTTLVGWVLWVVLNYALASRLLGGGAQYRQVLRAVGICYGPGVLLAAIAMPVVGMPIGFVGSAWVLVAGVVAVHETQDVDWLGAVLSTTPGWFLSFLFLPAVLLRPLAA